MASSVSDIRYTGFDNMGRLISHQQITDGETYSTAYSYNISGALIEETYPSGRVIKNTVNQDGEGRRVKKISSTETTVFIYDGTGRMVAEYSTALAQTQQVSYLTTFGKSPPDHE